MVSRHASIRLAIGFFLSALVSIGAYTQQKDPCAPPGTLGQELSTKYPGRRLVKLADLSEYDKRLYRKDHGGHCPGLIKVDFYGDKKPTWALILRTDAAGKSDSELFVARQDGNSWKFESLLKADSWAPVVWSEKPGKYEEIYGTKQITAPHPVIIWCDYGSSSIAFAWINDKVEKVWLTD